MAFKLLIFDTHPVQYRVPVWQTMNEIFPGSVHVVYASDCSVRGHNDVDFGRTFSWDEPLLSGYDSTILNCEVGKPLNGWNSLTGEGVRRQIKSVKPDAILLTGLNYRFDLVAFFYARINNIPVWLRCETQDDAFRRSRLKSLLRSMIYRMVYSQVDKFFFIGKLNRAHFTRHNVSPSKLKAACYATVDRLKAFTLEQKNALRNKTRCHASIPDTSLVIGFSGKFIEKKNPQLLFEMLEHLPQNICNRIQLYFIGSGPLEDQLRMLAGVASQRFGTGTFFSGFVNQTELSAHYLAMDILILPSRRMGETWGLVANEAMASGCSVVVSSAVGCGADFNSLNRFLVFQEGDAAALARCVENLSEHKRDFDWAKEHLKKYSIEAIANSFLDEMIPKRVGPLVVSSNHQ